MTRVDFCHKVSFLAPDLQQEVADFVSFLLSKQPKAPKSTLKKKRMFGCEKGSYYMAPDFDAPLEDFKDYM